MAGTKHRHPGGRPRTRTQSELGERIERLAARRGLHLDQLAAKAGVSVTTLYGVISGRGDPRLSTAKAIADALGVTLDRLAAAESARRSA